MKSIISSFLLTVSAVAIAQNPLPTETATIVVDQNPLPTETATVADTLLNAASAGSIEISAAKRSTNITVGGLNNTTENFYYQSKDQLLHMSYSCTNIFYNNVNNILVVNYEDRVSVDFTGEDGMVQNYTFYFENPADRQYKSYVGQNGREFGITIGRKGKVQWDVVTNGLTFGWGAVVNDSPDMNVSMWKSNEMSWTNILAVQMRCGRHAVSLGVGFIWQNYVTKGNRYFDLNMENRSISFSPYPEGAADFRSRIKLKSWQMPLLYRFMFGHKNYFNVVAGPVVCFSAGSSILTKYKLDGREYSVRTKNIGQRPVTVDLLAGFNYRAVGVYVRYSPMKKLRDRASLPFNTFSTGISLAF